MSGIQDSSQASDAFLNFVVDSFNIHRLVMAGVTCASKFFSDVFYTNSRYAKVCFRSPSAILWHLPFHHVVAISAVANVPFL